jgi:cathepsin D
VGCVNQRKYDAKKSSTSKEIYRIVSNSRDYKKNIIAKKDEVNIKFGTGEIKSYMIKDIVCMGNKENSICLNDFLFLSAYHLSEDPFNQVDFDGIIGLGFSDLSISQESNFLFNLMKTKKISNKIFAFYFRKIYYPIKHDKKLFDNSDSIYEYKEEYRNKLSELVIGGIDFDRIKGEIYFNEIISRRYWEVKMDNIYYGNIKLPFCKEVNCTAIIDTGTSTLGFSQNFFNVFKKLSNLEKNCSNLNTLKSLIFEIGGVFYELDSKDYTIKLRLNTPEKIEYMIPDNKVEEGYLFFLFYKFFLFNII